MNIFTHAAEQIENVRRWNKERELGFKEEQFESCRIVPDVSNIQKYFPLTAPVLVPYLPPVGELKPLQGDYSPLQSAPPEQKGNSTHRTCIQLARLLKVLHPNLKEGLSQYPQSHLLPNVDEPRPGLRWEVIDLGANLGQNPGACEDRLLSPHAGILAAACHFPEWVKLIEKEELPGVWIVGYADSYKIALFRNHDSRDAPKDQDSSFSLSGWASSMGNNVGNRAHRPMAVPRFREVGIWRGI